MPKRGSTTNGSVAVVPRKRQKNFNSEYSQNHGEQDENTPLNNSYYFTQLSKSTPDVNIIRFYENLHLLFVFSMFSYTKMLVLFLELV